VTWMAFAADARIARRGRGLSRLWRSRVAARCDPARALCVAALSAWLTWRDRGEVTWRYYSVTDREEGSFREAGTGATQLLQAGIGCAGKDCLHLRH